MKTILLRMVRSWLAIDPHPQPISKRSRPGRAGRARVAVDELETRLTPATWTGGGDGVHWSDSANWSGSVLPSNRDSLVFPANAKGLDNLGFFNLVDDLNGLTEVNSIAFTNSGPHKVRTYNITGTLPLTVDSGGIADTDPNPGNDSANGGSDNIGFPLILGADQTWTPGSRALDIGGTINTNGFTLTLGTPSSALIDIGKAISGGGNVKVDGAQTVIFRSANSYTGSTTVTDSGRLDIAADGALPGDVTVEKFGDLLFSRVDKITKHITITLDSGTIDAIGVTQFPGTINVTAAGPNRPFSGGQISGLDCTGDVTYGKFDETLSITVDGSLTGGGSLTGSLIINGSVSVPGTVTVDGGLEVNSSLSNDIDVPRGCSLGGIGTVTGNVTVHGKVTPGKLIGIFPASFQAGTLTVNGNVTFFPGVDLFAGYAPTADAQGHLSILSVSGTAKLDGTSIDNGAFFHPTNISVPPSGLTILTAGAVTGAFAKLPDGADFDSPGGSTIHYLATKVRLGPKAPAIAFPAPMPSARPLEPLAGFAVAVTNDPNHTEAGKIMKLTLLDPHGAGGKLSTFGSQAMVQKVGAGEAAIFRGLTISAVGQYQLRATLPDDTTRSSSDFFISEPTLSFPGNLPGSSPGLPIPDVTVTVKDDPGNIELGKTVTLTLANPNPNGAKLSPAKVQAIVSADHKAVFSGLSIDKFGTYQLTASIGDGTPPETSNSIDIKDTLALLDQPADTGSGKPQNGDIRVEALDANGKRDKTFDLAVTLFTTPNDPGNIKHLTVTAAKGVATFAKDTLRFRIPGTYTLDAFSQAPGLAGGMRSGSSRPFKVSAPGDLEITVNHPSPDTGEPVTFDATTEPLFMGDVLTIKGSNWDPKLGPVHLLFGQPDSREIFAEITTPPELHEDGTFHAVVRIIDMPDNSGNGLIVAEQGGALATARVTSTPYVMIHTGLGVSVPHGRFNLRTGDVLYAQPTVAFLPVPDNSTEVALRLVAAERDAGITSIQEFEDTFAPVAFFPIFLSKKASALVQGVLLLHPPADIPARTVSEIENALASGQGFTIEPGLPLPPTDVSGGPDTGFEILNPLTITPLGPIPFSRDFGAEGSLYNLQNPALTVNGIVAAGHGVSVIGGPNPFSIEPANRPDVKILTTADLSRKDVAHLGSAGKGTLTLDGFPGIAIAGGNYKQKGSIVLAHGGVLVVGGDLDVDGDISGQGYIQVLGNIHVHGRINLTAPPDEPFAISAGGRVTVDDALETKDVKPPLPGRFR